jgi:8-oxo-dGTP pyrophosphatase MutT (NUDIX family)
MPPLWCCFATVRPAWRSCLGCRHGQSSFLPAHYVFPGGRVDPADSGGPRLRLAPAITADLERAGRRPAAAFVRAAIRETEEETGLTFPDGHARGIDYVCRAITPACSPRRFDTRFFLGAGDLCQGTLSGNGELEDLCWRPVSALAEIRMLEVSRLVLREALQRWQLAPAPGRLPALQISYVGSRARYLRGGAVERR